MNYLIEIYEIVAVAVFGLLMIAVLAITVDSILMIPRVRRMVRGAMKASFPLLFLAVLGALLTLNWLHAGGDVGALREVLDPVADESGASEADDVLDRLLEWDRAGGCSCHANSDPESKIEEVVKCCVKEYCRLHNHRDPVFCDWVARN